MLADFFKTYGVMFTLLGGFVNMAYSKHVDRRDRREAEAASKNALIKSLYAEIDFNTKDMEVFLEKSWQKEAVQEKVRIDSSFVPHITDARHVIIYKSKISDLRHMEGQHISLIVYYYGLIDKISATISGIYQPSYSQISADGRAQVIENLFRDCRIIRDIGAKILRNMESEYSQLSLCREARDETREPTTKELSQRLRQLEVDLATRPIR